MGKGYIFLVACITEVLPLAIIIGGAAGGIAVIAVIILACVVYHKCKHSDNGKLINITILVQHVTGCI